MSYFTDHLAWQQRVNQEINASNKFIDSNIVQNPYLQSLLNQQQSASQSPIPQMRSTTGFSVGHSNPSGMVNQEPLAGSKQDFVIVTPDGGLQMRSRQGARNSTPSKTSSSKINQALYAFGGKTSVRGNDMYDFMRNKYRPLSSKKNAQRYHYGRATSQDRSAHIYNYAKNSPLARTSYQQNFQNSATQLPQPYHPRPTEAVQKQRKKQNSVEEEDKPHRFNQDWKNVYNPGGSKSRSVYSKRTISQALTPSGMQHHHHQHQREYSPTGLLVKKASPTYSQQMSHSNLKTSNSSNRDKIMNQLSRLPDSDLQKIGHALRIDTSENFEDHGNNVQINPTTIEEKKPKGSNKSGMITKENLDKLNEVQGLQNIQGGAGSELDEQENADKIEELKENEVKKSRIGAGSVIMSESRVSIGKSTYTYLNSLEQRLEDEKNAREKLQKELEFIKKQLSTTSHSRK